MEKFLLDESARAGAPGKFVKLSDGYVHYEMAGKGKRTVVLICGLSVPYYIWDATFGALVEAGFRVLRYDLFGRGYSDRPDVAYDGDLFDRQLSELLLALGIDAPSDLVGVSMGGCIAVFFADRHPEIVRRLCLIGPAGMPAKIPFFMRLLNAHPLGEIIMELFGGKMLLGGLSDDLHQPQKFPEYVERYKEQMRYKGFARAILVTLRSGFLTGVKDSYHRVGKTKRETLLIWGKEDKTVPFAQSEKVREAIPHAKFHAIPNCGHVPHYEKPEVVNPILIEFLRKK